MDNLLLTRIAAGDRAAVPECLSRYGALVWTLTRRRLGFGLFLALAASCSGHAEDVDPATLTTLTVEQARALSLSGRNDLRFDALTTLSAESAAGFAEFKGRLFLEKLTELPPQVAQALTSFRGELRLSGLKEISVETAAALGKPGRKGALWLGLESLPVDVARGLAPHTGPLMFHGIRTLPDDAAEAIAARAGTGLDFAYLTDISEKGLIALARSKCNLLILKRLPAITDDAAVAIGEHVGKTMLNMGLQSLSDNAARALVKNKNLHLPKTLRMSPAAAETLRNAMGDRAPTAIP